MVVSKKKTVTPLPHYANKMLSDLPGEEWRDIPGLEGYGMISNLGRVKRCAFELQNSAGRFVFYPARIQAQKIQRSANRFKGDYKQHLTARIQIGRACHSISLGRTMYYCFVEKFDLSDSRLYVTYKDGNGLNTAQENLLLVNHSGLQQRIMQSGRKDLHFGHSEANQQLFSERGRAASRKKVSRYSMQGEFMATYGSLAQAAEEVGVSVAAISRVALRKPGALSAGGSIWRFGTGKKVIPVKRIHRAIRATKGSPISQYDLEGKKIKTWNNIAQAAVAIGINRRTLSSAVNGEVLVFHHSIWRKGEEEKIDVSRERRSLALRNGYMLSQYDLEGRKVATFTSSLQAARAMGVQIERINAMAIRDDLVLKGFIFRYGDRPELSSPEVEHILYKLSLPKRKDVTRYDLTGKKTGHFSSISMAAKTTGIAAGAINGCVDGHKATAGGSIWRRGKGDAQLTLPETPRPLGNKLQRTVVRYNHNGTATSRYPSIAEAARQNGLHTSTIANAIRNGATAGGFLWKKEV